MPMRTSTRLKAVQPSLTLEITAKAKELQAEGKDVISLSAGEPDFSPPDTVHEAACAAIRANDARYTATAGTPVLRKAIAERTKKDHGLEYAIDEIVVTSGAKQAIFNAIYVLVDPGEEIIIPAPYWTSYPEMAQALGAVPVIWNTSSADGFKLHADALAKLITPKTRAVILNSPNNPTGALISEAELRDIAAVLRGKDIWIITDDIYERLVFTGHEAKNILVVAPELRDRTIVVNGLSKTYCMTGWRVGYAMGPKAAIRAMEIIQGHSTSCANAIAQAASVVALTKIGPEHIRMMIGEYMRRARFVHGALTAIPGVLMAEPKASFYAFPDVSAYFGRRWKGKTIASSMDVCRILLEDHHVACVPGEAFGYKEAIRLSYATSMAELERALTRVTAFFHAIER